jgi:hypothetical protein
VTIEVLAVGGYLDGKPGRFPWRCVGSHLDCLLAADGTCPLATLWSQKRGRPRETASTEPSSAWGQVAPALPLDSATSIRVGHDAGEVANTPSR